MKYTKYFGLISRTQGQLNLPPSEFQRMMNIVHLCGPNHAKESYADTKLSELTGSIQPDELLQEMVRCMD